MQAEEAEHLRKDRDDKRTSLSAVQEEVQMHREQVRKNVKPPSQPSPEAASHGIWQGCSTCDVWLPLLGRWTSEGESRAWREAGSSHAGGLREGEGTGGAGQEADSGGEGCREVAPGAEEAGARA